MCKILWCIPTTSKSVKYARELLCDKVLIHWHVHLNKQCKHGDQIILNTKCTSITVAHKHVTNVQSIDYFCRLLNVRNDTGYFTIFMNEKISKLQITYYTIPIRYIIFNIVSYIIFNILSVIKSLAKLSCNFSS